MSDTSARTLPSRGARVRLRPRAGGDVLDLVLIGKPATVESVEQDLEGNYLVSVVLDDDPGAYLGIMRQPGHRFFFAPDELEVLPDDGRVRAPGAPRILVAGIGNIFLGDDGFGVEVAQRLAARRLPAGVTVVDYGIRGYDLAYALLAQPDHAILVDACPRGEGPGTLFVMEPDLGELGRPSGDPGYLDGHAMNPVSVLRLARSLGGELKPVVVVGCEPATLGPEEGAIGLSAPVEAAVDPAITLIESLIARYLDASANPEPGDLSP
jgi:hydrogenase maturation protease